MAGPHDYGSAGLRAGRRASSRLRVRLPARLTALKGNCSAILEDLSFNGARLSLKGAPPKVGSELVVEWGRYEGFGVVSWAKGNTIGVQFYDPIAPDVVIATRDIDDVEHMPADWEENRRAARNFVNGT